MLGYIGTMEKNLETTTLHVGLYRDNGKWKLLFYIGYDIGNLKRTWKLLFSGYIGVMGKKMEATVAAQV